MKTFIKKISLFFLISLIIPVNYIFASDKTYNNKEQFTEQYDDRKIFLETRKDDLIIKLNKSTNKYKIKSVLQIEK